MPSFSYVVSNYMMDNITCPKCDRSVFKMEVNDEGFCKNCGDKMSDDPHDMTNDWIEFIAKRGEN
tara:strand:- start:5089 stop:5283 length:195 start_codon:yes stop_codon:yes gene_type:complete